MQMETLPEELILQSTSFLDVTSLLTCRTLNRKFRLLCSRNEAGWDILCHNLWKDKVFVCPHARALDSSLHAYRQSLHDAKIRQHLLLDELCFDTDPKQQQKQQQQDQEQLEDHSDMSSKPHKEQRLPQEPVVWSFRFKESAGPDWTSWDPWWNGMEARRMVFLRDGSVRQYTDEGELADPPVPMSWRFSARPMDLPQRRQGSYIRFTVGGRDVPTYVVRRSPTQNWGFIAESCWGVYTSFRMPLRNNNKTASSSTTTTTATVTTLLRNRQASRERNPRRWLGTVRGDNIGEQGEGEERHTVPPLTDDSSFIITNEVQWREALLYNFGATVLPEGESAMEDFDRMFTQQF